MTGGALPCLSSPPCVGRALCMTMRRLCPSAPLTPPWCVGHALCMNHVRHALCMTMRCLCSSPPLDVSVTPCCAHDAPPHRNAPNVHASSKLPNPEAWHGAELSVTIEGSWSSYRAKVLKYLRQIAVITPYAQVGGAVCCVVLHARCVFVHACAVCVSECVECAAWRGAFEGQVWALCGVSYSRPLHIQPCSCSVDHATLCCAPLPLASPPPPTVQLQLRCRRPPQQPQAAVQAPDGCDASTTKGGRGMCVTSFCFDL